MQDSIYDKNESYGHEIESVFAKNRIKKTKKIIERIIQKNKIKNCLDVGTGTGYFLDFVKRVNKKIDCFGIDISVKAIILAKNNYRNINFSQDDIISFTGRGGKKV
ncbi:MAG: methyltransferase domain-containing protein [Patescibacteria group bacterium]